MSDIELYKGKVLEAMLSIKDTNGMSIIDEKTAKELLKDLGDDTLEECMLFNTPEEAADFIIKD